MSCVGGCHSLPGECCRYCVSEADHADEYGGMDPYVELTASLEHARHDQDYMILCCKHAAWAEDHPDEYRAAFAAMTPGERA